MDQAGRYTAEHTVMESGIGIFDQSGSMGQISRTTGETLQAEIETSIVSMDEIETANGRLKIKFIDDTLVSLTENTYKFATNLN